MGSSGNNGARRVSLDSWIAHHQEAASRIHPSTRPRSSEPTSINLFFARVRGSSCCRGRYTVAVQMELSRIVINENGQEQIIFLREVDGPRQFPIVIGLFEANSIERRVRGIVAQRPLTHDLLVNTIEALGGELQDVFITELRDHTYYAKLRVRFEGELIQIDSRPSDALAVAVTADVPIYVAEDVITEAMQS
ncbi:protein of unknown function DUF151 [Isosphaera pallida ATCC 43644]|jgi:bifunctional DNase/RNase|uniref:BFN domain-containing protein n=1 Tax=Isosphaera pallida (strain ATCC 43644 / DSM 9630 / IS1B) TaxID=575540 RepID=E8QZI0_ISOPI|nr:protein of unknown function DUF151 [Isosphaera pallida ATCC 43644]